LSPRGNPEWAVTPRGNPAWTEEADRITMECVRERSATERKHIREKAKTEAARRLIRSLALAGRIPA